MNTATAGMAQDRGDECGVVELVADRGADGCLHLLLGVFIEVDGAEEIEDLVLGVAGDAGEGSNHGRDTLPGVHERLILVDDRAATHLDDRDLHDAVAIPRAPTRRLHIDHRERHLRQGSTERCQSRVEAPHAFVVHQEARISSKKLEDGRRCCPGMPRKSGQ